MFYSLMTKDLSIKKLLTQAFFQMYTYATYSLKFLRNNQFEFAVFKIMTTQKEPIIFLPFCKLMNIFKTILVYFLILVKGELLLTLE